MTQRSQRRVEALAREAQHLGGSELHALISRLQRLEEYVPAGSWSTDDDLDVAETLANKNALA